MIATLSAEPLAPAWLIVPIGSVVILLIAAHVGALRRAEMPESRRRIREANGLLMLCGVPLATYALCMASPSDSRAFLLSWTACVGLVGLVLLLAVIDAVNTLRLHWAARAALRMEIARARAAMHADAR